MDISEATRSFSRRGILLTQKPQVGSSGGTTAGYTFCTAMSVAAAFEDIRAMFVNHNTAASITITSAAFAPSAKLNDGVNPVDSDGNAVAWTPILFGGTPSVTIPAATDATSVDDVPSVVQSDWVGRASLDRADGGLYPLVFIRVYLAATGHAPTSAVAHQTAYLARTGHNLSAFYASGDHISANTVISGATAATQIYGYAVQTLSRKRGLSVAAFGDSLTQGFTTVDTTSFTGWLSRACSDLTAETFPGVAEKLPMAFQNMGLAGRTTTGTYNNFNALIDFMSPDVAFLAVYSPNDAGSDWPGQYRKAMKMALTCIQKGIIPVLVTPQPWSYTGANETARLDLVARVKASGLLYADIDAAVKDPSQPSRVLPSLAGPDGKHLSLEVGGGQDAAAEAAKVPLRVIARSLLYSGMPT